MANPFYNYDHLNHQVPERVSPGGDIMRFGLLRSESTFINGSGVHQSSGPYDSLPIRIYAA